MLHRCQQRQAEAKTGTASTAAATAKLNSALYTVALSRASNHQPTRDYRDRRRSEGKTDREIRRCVKRSIARRVWRLLEHPPAPEIAT